MTIIAKKKNISTVTKKDKCTWFQLLLLYLNQYNTTHVEDFQVTREESASGD